MKNKYKQFTSEERDLISMYHSQGMSNLQIAKKLKRHKASIGRELKRNSSAKYDVYLANKAHQRSVIRKHESGIRPRLKSQKLERFVIRNLKRKRSPEQIAGELRLKHSKNVISAEAIYQFIYAKETRKKHNLVQYLARGHRKRYPRRHSHRHRKIHIPQRVPIEKRPKYSRKNEPFGHWEADTAGRKKKGAQLTIVHEKKSLLVKLKRIRRRTATNFRIAINKMLCKYPEHMLETMTFDNGSENVEHMKIAKTLDLDTFFCAPYHSWEKGGVENSVSRVRRYFPKSTDFDKISDKEIKRVERLMNNCPRKKLGFRTPLQVFKSGVALAH